MKNNIFYSPEAQSDLDEIWEYIFADLCNPQAAENTVNKIMDAVDKLEDFSEIGTRLFSVTGFENDYRFLVSGNYMVFYRTVGENVYIDRIMYGRRDYLRVLFPDIYLNMKLDRGSENPALAALKEESRIAEENGISDMTLDEINAEIAEARKQEKIKELGI